MNLINQVKSNPDFIYCNTISSFKREDKLETLKWYLSQSKVSVPIALIEDLLISDPTAVNTILLSQKLMRISKGQRPSLYEYIRIVKS